MSRASRGVIVALATAAAVVTGSTAGGAPPPPAPAGPVAELPREIPSGVELTLADGDRFRVWSSDNHRTVWGRRHDAATGEARGDAYDLPYRYSIHSRFRGYYVRIVERDGAWTVRRSRY